MNVSRVVATTNERRLPRATRQASAKRVVAEVDADFVAFPVCMRINKASILLDTARVGSKVPRHAADAAGTRSETGSGAAGLAFRARPILHPMAALVRAR